MNVIVGRLGMMMEGEEDEGVRDKGSKGRGWGRAMRLREGREVRVG